MAENDMKDPEIRIALPILNVKNMTFFDLGILDDFRRVPSGYQVVRNDSENFE